MAAQPRDRTPRRTTEHIVADLGVNHLERLFLLGGHSPMGVPKDYGYDVTVVTHSRAGYSEGGLIYVQLKASARLRLQRRKQSYAFSISREHFNLWRAEPMPVFLVRYCRHRNRAFWLYLQPYFLSHELFKRSSQRTATIHIPARNRLDEAAVEYMRQKKQEAVNVARAAIQHRT